MGQNKAYLFGDMCLPYAGARGFDDHSQKHYSPERVSCLGCGLANTGLHGCGKSLCPLVISTTHDERLPVKLCCLTVLFISDTAPCPPAQLLVDSQKTKTKQLNHKKQNPCRDSTLY